MTMRTELLVFLILFAESLTALRVGYKTGHGGIFLFRLLFIYEFASFFLDSQRLKRPGGMTQDLFDCSAKLQAEAEKCGLKIQPALSRDIVSADKRVISAMVKYCQDELAKLADCEKDQVVKRDEEVGRLCYTYN